jgi:hypothetical protein
VKYIVRPRNDRGFGSFSVAASEAREALDVVRGMTERGLEDIEILDSDGTPYDLAELERITSESENA